RHTSFSRDWSSDVCSSDLYWAFVSDSLLLLLHVTTWPGARLDGRRPPAGHAPGWRVSMWVIVKLHLRRGYSLPVFHAVLRQISRLLPVFALLCHCSRSSRIVQPGCASAA